MRDSTGRDHASPASSSRSSARAEVDFDAEHDRGRAERVSAMLLRRQVQKKAAAAASTETTHAAAERGAASPTTSLPFGDTIQASFGAAHDVSRIQAHVGGDSASQMGASAYATGNHVVFDKQPDLHTAAHEAAHVVQQAQGVNLYGGVGEAGDSYERHADAVADLVVAGQSAADLLGPSSSGGGVAAVQKKDKKEPEKAPATAHEATSDSDVALVDSVMLVAQRIKQSRMTITSELDKMQRADRERQAGHASGDERGSAPAVEAVREAMDQAKDGLANLTSQHALELLKYTPNSEMRHAYAFLDREILLYAPTYDRAQTMFERTTHGRAPGSFQDDFRGKVGGDLSALGTTFEDLRTTGEDARMDDKHLAASTAKENVIAMLECAQAAKDAVHSSPAKVPELVARTLGHVTALTPVDSHVLKAVKEFPKAIAAARAMAADIRAAGLQKTGLGDHFEATLNLLVAGAKK